MNIKLKANLIKGEKKKSQYLGEGLHGEWPLGDKFIPAGERGEDREEVVPQFSADVDV